MLSWAHRHTRHDSVQDTLAGAAAAMAQYKVTHALDDAEEPLYEAACKALTSTAAPFIAGCFARVYQGGSAVLDLGKAMAPLAPPIPAQTPQTLSAQPSGGQGQLITQGPSIAEQADEPKPPEGSLEESQAGLGQTRQDVGAAPLEPSV